MALVTLRSYRDPIDAELAKLRLETAGIPVVVADQHLVGVQWLWSIAIGGVKVKVEESDLAQAREVLREDHSADLAAIPESAAPAEDDECPVCGSAQVEPSRSRRVGAALSLAIGIPIPYGKDRWVCRACGHAWKMGDPDPHAEDPPATLAAEHAVHEGRSYPRVLVAILIALVILYYLYYRIHTGGGA